MKNILFSNWNLMRWFRLGFALFLFVQAVVTHEWFLLVFGLFFIVQAFFNLGCGSNGCGITNYKNKKDE